MGRRPNSSKTRSGSLSFVKVLYSNFSRKLSIPPNYVRLHGQTLAKTCILQPIHKSRSWSVSTKQIGNILYFRKGWNVFAQENSLEFGDFLCFQYAGDSKFYVDMYDSTCCSKQDVTSSHGEITRDASCIHSSQKIKVDASTADLINTAEKLRSRSEFPSFVMVMQPAYSAYLHVPSYFAKLHLKGSTRHVKIESSGKTWKVKLMTMDGYGLKSTRGWVGVVRDKHLELGDVCVFEFINQDDVLKLSVIRKNSDLKEEKRKFNQLNTKSSSSGRFTVKNQEGFNMALTLKSRSKNLSYIVSMRPAYLEHGYLHVTSTFLNEMQMRDGAHKLKLLYLGKEWEVDLKIDGSYGRINKGWRTFVKENSLQMHDVCFLELINKEDAVMEISIFRYTTSYGSMPKLESSF